MPVIRPTARLWRELNGRGRLPDYVAPSHEPCRMSDWFATSMSVLRERMVLFAHRETIFTVLAPMAPLEALAATFRQALERELIRIEIPSEIIKRETEGLIDISIAKTDDRSGRRRAYPLQRTGRVRRRPHILRAATGRAASQLGA